MDTQPIKVPLVCFYITKLHTIPENVPLRGGGPVFRTGPKSNSPKTYHSWTITLRCLETSGFDYPLMQRHSPPEGKPQLHRCENLKFSKGRHCFTDCYSVALTGLHHCLLQAQMCCFKANDPR